MEARRHAEAQGLRELKPVVACCDGILAAISVAPEMIFKRQARHVRALGALRMRASLAPDVTETVEPMRYSDEIYEALEESYALKIDSGVLWTEYIALMVKMEESVETFPGRMQRIE